jgi:PadR family transcriptional regulator, regulatory protein PadR
MGKQDVLQGTLDLLILKAVSLEPVHGYGILLRIEQLSGGKLQILQGSLYPALYRLETRGWIAAEWGESENNRRAKFYKLTGEGRRQLKAETENWKRLSSGVTGVLDAQAEQL